MLRGREHPDLVLGPDVGLEAERDGDEHHTTEDQKSSIALAFDGRLADMTREGYLFQWWTRAPACQSEWPSFRHDQQDSGNYNHDGTPPGAPSNMTLSPLGAGLYRLSFTAPGNDGPCGTPASYVTELDGTPLDLGLGLPVAGQTTFSADVALPPGSGQLSLQAIDAAGNIGPAGTIALPAATP